MPTITPSMIPTKSPGTIFDALTGGDTTLNIRWLTSIEPCYYETLNRPTADLAVRQLVIAKALDNTTLAMGHVNLYPFMVQPKVSSGSVEVNVPLRWIWDIHASLPKRWENLRLAKIKRVAGENSLTGSYTGILRLIFTANVEGSTAEVAVFQAEYEIDSPLTFQPMRLSVVQQGEESLVLDQSESESVGGFITFKTLDTDLQETIDFLDTVAPPSTTTDADSDGYYDTPAVYDISDTDAGGTHVTDDYAIVSVSHGSGLLIDSAWNSIPNMNVDIQSWIDSFNYPFDASANLRSVNGIVIPRGLFREFDITAPAGDQPDGDASGTYYPVWISRIERTDMDTLRVSFSTYNTTIDNPSTAPIEFASLTLPRTGQPGDRIDIVVDENLKMETGSEWTQHLGRGHVVLSSLWNDIGGEITDFFDSFNIIVGTPVDTEFTVSATRISSFGISRVPMFTPTKGQAEALRGSSARKSAPEYPSDSNRFVTEADQGLGDQIDLESETGITPNSVIDRYGYTGSLCHRVVRLVVDAEKVGSNPNFYDEEILPRLTILFGRPPRFGDYWFNGTRLMFYTGDVWIG